MQTKQAIQSSANVIRITSVSAGDVYKRFDKSYDDRTYYGVVKAVHNDGEKTIIEATEYSYRWSSIDVAHKILKGEEDYVLFPCTPEEFNLDLSRAIKEKEEAINSNQRKIEEDKRLIAEMEKLVSGETQKALTAMSYSEITQVEYNQKKQALLG